MKAIKIQIDGVYDRGKGGIERYTIVFFDSTIANSSLFRQKQCLQFTDNLAEYKEGIILWRSFNLNDFGEKIKYSDLSVDIRDRFKNVLQAEIYDEEGNIA